MSWNDLTQQLVDSFKILQTKMDTNSAVIAFTNLSQMIESLHLTVLHPVVKDLKQNIEKIKTVQNTLIVNAIASISVYEGILWGMRTASFFTQFLFQIVSL